MVNNLDTEEGVYMDPVLAELVSKDAPALNRSLADGLATDRLKYAEECIDVQMRSVATFFPKDLVYEGFQPCLPNEEYSEITKRKTINRAFKYTYNLARSDTYMVKYFFKFKGQPIVRYISLPFLNQDDTIHINGVKFIISPVLCDRIISVGPQEVFVKLNLAKLKFKTDPVIYVADDQPDIVQLLHSEIYNRTSKNKELPKNVKAKTTMVHYLFCRYGVHKTFKEFGGFQAIIGNDKTVNIQKYPPSDWVICRSMNEYSGTKPRTLSLSRDTIYRPTTLRLAIKREQYTSNAKNYIAGFFYLADHWPDRIKPEYIDDQRIWKQLMGELIWGSTAPLGRLETDAEKHLSSLDNYIDTIMKFKFAEIGIKIDNLYQLFAIIIEHFNDWVLSSGSDVSSVYGKELQVLYYVLGDIVTGINNFYFNLKNAYAKKGDIDLRELTTIMNRTLYTGAIYNLSRTDKHPEVSTINTSSDCKAFKTTAILVPQETHSKSGNKSSNNPTQFLHVSVAECNTYSAINKKDPSGHNRINHCAMIDDKGALLRNPEFKELLDNIQLYLDRTA